MTWLSSVGRFWNYRSARRRSANARRPTFRPCVEMLEDRCLLSIGFSAVLGSISEFSTPTPNSEPGALTAGPDGNVWFSEYGTSDYVDWNIGRITPAGVVTEFPLSHPHAGAITTGSDGNLWFTENTETVGIFPPTNPLIAKMTPAGVVAQTFSLPSGSAPGALVLGQDGNIWFTEYWNSKIGYIKPTGQVTEFTTNFAAANLIQGPDGAFWFTSASRGANQNVLGRITTNGVETDFAIPNAGLLRGLAFGPDGNLWTCDTDPDNQIVVFNPSTDQAVYWSIPTPASGPYSIVQGGDGAMWFTESNVSQIGRITVDGSVTEYPSPTSNAGLASIIQGPDGNLWITEQNSSQVGKIAISGQQTQPLPTPPLTAIPGVSQAFDLGAFTDPGVAGPWTVQVNWGDQTGLTTFNVASTGEVGAQAHTYASQGAYSVTVTVTDNLGASAATQFQAVVGPVVVNTRGSGPGSLSQAINEVNTIPSLTANGTVQAHVTFNIPTTDPGYQSATGTFVIHSGVPAVEEPIFIDGYSQPGASPNTLAIGDNAVLPITVEGDLGAGESFLEDDVGNGTVRGLRILNFDYFALGMAGTNNVIQGNIITILANEPAQFGIGLVGSESNPLDGTRDTLVGGTNPADRNVISGYLADVSIFGSDPTAPGALVEGNYIGTNEAGTGPAAFPGIGDGIDIEDNNNTIGGNAPGAGNTISYNPAIGINVGGTGNRIEGNTITSNQGSGVEVDGTDDRIVDNSIYGNGGPGIALDSLSGSGIIVPNEPGGPFTGPNNAAFNLTATVSGSEVIVTGTLNGLANTTYATRIYAATESGGAIEATYASPFNFFLFTTDATGTADVSVTFALSDLGNLIGPINGAIGNASPPHLGGNYLQNYPVLTAAQSGANVLVSGTLNGQASTTFTVDVYASPTAAPSGYGQGQYYLGETTVTTDASGNTSFAADFSAANLPGGVLLDGWAVSATATDPNGNTSEFSADVFASSTDALQQALTSGGTVNVQATTPEQAQAVLAAANNLNAATTPASTIVLDLGGQTIQDTNMNLPPQVKLTVVNGTFIGGSPALIVSSGQVIISNSTFTNSTDAPTILVTGGSLTLRNDIVQESTGYRDAAVSVTGGTVDLGTAADPGGNTFNINGRGLFISNTGANPIAALGDTFERNGAAVTDPYRIENHIIDALDAGGGGLVTFVAGNVYVTKRTGSIQRAVDAVAAGGTVNVKAGAYTGYNIGAKPLTIQFQNGPTITQAADPEMPGVLSLTVHGWATGDDRIEFNAGDAGSVHVDINDVPRGTFAPTGRLIAYGGAGLTDISVDGAISLSAWLFAGTGNTRLTGGGGNNVLVGGAGTDELIGGSGRDLMIGGSGASTLRGNGGDDILISGYTVYDANDAALWAIMAEWTSADSFTQRVADLSDATSSAGFANRRNGNYFLIADATVFNDPNRDKLNGGAGADWLFADAADKIDGLTRSDDLTLFP